jgi:hypothetical protein
MTRDDIERMAVEAGGGTPEWDGIWEMSGDALERFAALVVAAEREACADIASTCCEGCADDIRARGDK